MTHKACLAILILCSGCDSGTPAGRPEGPVNQPQAAAARAPNGTLSPVRGGTLSPKQQANCNKLTFPGTSNTDALPGGIWYGLLLDCGAGIAYDYALALVGDDGTFRILGENGHLLTGTLSTSGDTFRGTGVDFAATGTEYFSGSTTNMFVEGVIAERQTLEGRWGTEWGSYGYFSFEFNPHAYFEPTSLKDLAAEWSTYTTEGVEGTWTVEADGRFSGEDQQGCLQTGQFSLIDSRFSLMAVEVTVTACGLAGRYSGLAFYQDLIDWWDAGITISIDDGARALRSLLVI